MQLISIIPTAEQVEALEPEELGLVMVKHMNWIAAREKNLFHYNNYCNGESNAYMQAGQRKVNRELMVAWGYLATCGLLAQDPGQTSGWHFLTKRALSLKLDGDYKNFRSAVHFPKGRIHPEIEAETFAEFLRGDYDTAIFKAFRRVEVAVRDAAKLPQSLIGTSLVRKAFDASDGVLTDHSEEPAEREALSHLFAGAIGRFKNPSSHRAVDYSDSDSMIEAIGLASLLLRIVDMRKVRGPT